MGPIILDAGDPTNGRRGEQANVLRPRAVASADERSPELAPGYRVLEIRARIDVEDDIGAKDANQVRSFQSPTLA